MILPKGFVSETFIKRIKVVAIVSCILSVIFLILPSFVETKTINKLSFTLTLSTMAYIKWIILNNVFGRMWETFELNPNKPKDVKSIHIHQNIFN